MIQSARGLQESLREQYPYWVKVLNKNFVVYPRVFSPKYFVDTELFTKNLPINKDEHFLEIGCGTGITSVIAALKGAHVTAVDISLFAVLNTWHNALLHHVNVDVKYGSLFQPLSDSVRFDTIYWNTPFRFSSISKLTVERRALFDPGYAHLKKFLRLSKKYLNPKGKVILGISPTIGNMPRLIRLLTLYGYTFETIFKKTTNFGVCFELWRCTT